MSGGSTRHSGTASCSWGTELWDQFDSLEKHTAWGIDFLERYTKFVKERADIELSYAKQLRNLSKKYQPKKGCREDEEARYSWGRAFGTTLRELGDYAGHREALAQTLHTQLTSELSRCTQEMKAERKSHFQDGRRAQQHIENSWKHLESSKRRFERDCKEAERAQQHLEHTHTQVEEKVRQAAQIKQQAVEDSKREYLTSLNQFNQDQRQHYHTLVPVIYQRIQDMEERRIERIGEVMHSLVEVERKILPVITRCLDVMTDSADSVQPRLDSVRVLEVYKSGFDPPGDVVLEEHTAPIRRSISESSYLDNRTEGDSQRKSRGRLWPFIRKNKPPPPPPTSPSPGGVSSSPQSPPPRPREPITQRLNDLMTSGSRTRKHCLRSLKRGGSAQEDYSHLPPDQRKKKLENRIGNLQVELQKEREQKEALVRLREAYERNPEMGDTSSLKPRMDDITHTLEKLEREIHTHLGWLAEAENKLTEPNSRRQSGSCGFDSQATTPGSSSLSQLDNLNNQGPASRESPDGSYTEDHSGELNVKSRSSEFDDDFDEEPLPSIGTCKSLYPFQGQNEGTISMVEGELLSVVEEDKGDGWTRVRRNLEEEGYVPTSYIKVFLDSNAKGCVQASRLV